MRDAVSTLEAGQPAESFALRHGKPVENVLGPNERPEDRESLLPEMRLGQPCQSPGHGRGVRSPQTSHDWSLEFVERHVVQHKTNVVDGDCDVTEHILGAPEIHVDPVEREM